MTTNISVKTKIRVNGQDYASVEDMPPHIRQAYERAMAAMPGAKHSGLLSTLGNGLRANAQTVSNAKVIFNGQEYGSVDQMPANVRHLYQAVMATIESDTLVAPETGAGVQAVSQSGNSAGSLPTPTAPGSIRLESANWRLVLVAVGILLLAWLGFGRTMLSP
jgi:hypothetical protein